MDEFLREAVRVRGWNLARLAEACDVSDGLVTKWVSGNPRVRVIPSPASCDKIAAALGEDPDYILELAGHRQPQSPQEPRDPIEQEIRARASEMRDALRGIPQRFWPTIIRSTFDQAIRSARGAADLARELAITAPPVKHDQNGPVERPTAFPNTAPDGSDADFSPREAGVNASGAGAVPRHGPIRNLSMVAVAGS